MIWDSTKLFEKAAVYLQRANAENRDDDSYFALGVTLGFEFLARAALANVHPALLADPQSPDSLLHVFGFPGKKSPKSVPMKTVLHRLTIVLEDFSTDDFSFATSIIEMRNAELHSDELPFEVFKREAWLPQLMRLCRVLCETQGKSLEDLVGSEEVGAVEQQIGTLEDQLKKEAHDVVRQRKTSFDELEVESRLERVKQAKEEAADRRTWQDRVVKCPSCGSDALLSGKVVRSLPPNVTEDGVEERAVIMPTSLECFACELTLTKYGYLFHLGFGDQQIVESWKDPVEYFGIEFNPEDFFEPDYGND